MKGPSVLDQYFVVLLASHQYPPISLVALSNLRGMRTSLPSTTYFKDHDQYRKTNIFISLPGPSKRRIDERSIFG